MYEVTYRTKYSRKSITFTAKAVEIDRCIVPDINDNALSFIHDDRIILKRDLALFSYSIL